MDKHVVSKRSTSFAGDSKRCSNDVFFSFVLIPPKACFHYITISVLARGLAGSLSKLLSESFFQCWEFFMKFYCSIFVHVLLRRWNTSGHVTDSSTNCCPCSNRFKMCKLRQATSSRSKLRTARAALQDQRYFDGVQIVNGALEVPEAYMVIS